MLGAAERCSLKAEPEVISLQLEKIQKEQQLLKELQELQIGQ